MIVGDSRLAVKCAGAIILAWKATATGRDGAQAGGTRMVVTRGDGSTVNEAPRTDEEAGCGRAIGTIEWGGAGTTVVCNAMAA